MLPDRVLNPGPLTYESGALPIALRDPACSSVAHAMSLIIVTMKQNRISKKAGKHVLR